MKTIKEYKKGIVDLAFGAVAIIVITVFFIMIATYMVGEFKYQLQITMIKNYHHNFQQLALSSLLHSTYDDGYENAPIYKLMGEYVVLKDNLPDELEDLPEEIETRLNETLGRDPCYRLSVENEVMVQTCPYIRDSIKARSKISLPYGSDPVKDIVLEKSFG